MYTTLSHSEKTTKTASKGLVQSVNNWITKNQTNYFGICGMALIVGTAITSIPVAIATAMQLFVIVGICAVFAMAVNVMVISQQTLKTVVWSFLIGMTVNIALLIYLISISFLS
jgi:uncharacterized membrane protein